MGFIGGQFEGELPVHRMNSARDERPKAYRRQTGQQIEHYFRCGHQMRLVNHQINTVGGSPQSTSDGPTETNHYQRPTAQQVRPFRQWNRFPL